MKGQLIGGLAGTSGTIFLLIWWWRWCYYSKATTQAIDEYSVAARILPRYAKTDILATASINVCLRVCVLYAVYL